MSTPPRRRQSTTSGGTARHGSVKRRSVPGRAISIAQAGRVDPAHATTPAREVSIPKPRDPETLAALANWISTHQPTPDQSKRIQARIHDEMMRLSRAIDRPNFLRVGRDDLVRLIYMMDEAFFDSRVLPVAKAEGLQFKFSSRMTSAAGKLVTHYPSPESNQPRQFELVLSSTLLFQTFEDVNRPVTVTGRKCRDRLEAMQRVAEHEMTHLIEMLIWNEGTCSQPRFQTIARNYFGHRDYRHDLITQRERAAAKFNIRVGDLVWFANAGQRVVGKVNRITRRATVLVEDPKGQRFSDGARYLRYYVPLESLHPVG